MRVVRPHGVRLGGIGLVLALFGCSNAPSAGPPLGVSRERAIGDVGEGAENSGRMNESVLTEVLADLHVEAHALVQASVDLHDDAFRGESRSRPGTTAGGARPM